MIRISQSLVAMVRVFIKTSNDFHGIFTNACYHSVNAPVDSGVARAANKYSQGG